MADAHTLLRYREDYEGVFYRMVFFAWTTSPSGVPKVVLSNYASVGVVVNSSDTRITVKRIYPNESSLNIEKN